MIDRLYTIARKIQWVSLVLLTLVLLPVYGQAQDVQQADSYSIFQDFDPRTAIEPFADDVEFFPEDDLVILRGNASVVYRDNSIKADEIVLDLKEGELRANRNVVLWSHGERLHGERLIYDLRKKKATLIASELQVAGMRFRGEEMEFKHEDNEIEIKNAWITGCDMIEPHYHLENERAKIVAGKRFWTYNTLFYLGNLPVMYLPFFTRSLRDDWKGHIVSYTHSSQRGFGLINKYNLHFNPLWRIALYGDWYPGYGYGVGIKESYHRQRGRPMDGKIYLYYLDLKGEEEDLRDIEERYKIAGVHRQELYDDLVMTAYFQKLSDREFNDDLEDEEKLRGWSSRDLQTNRNSYWNLAYTKPDYNLRLFVKENLNDFQLGEMMEDERSPEIRWDERRQLIPGLPVYRKVHFDYSRLSANQEFSLMEDSVWWQRQDEMERLDFAFDLEAPFTAWKWLRITPLAGYQYVRYDDPEQRWTLRDINGERFNVSDPIVDRRDRDYLNQWPGMFYNPATNRLVPGAEFASHWDNVNQHVGKLGVEFSTRMVRPLGSTARFSQMRLVIEPTVTGVGYYTSEDYDDLVPKEFAINPGYANIPAGFPGVHAVPPVFPEIDEVDGFRRTAHILRTGLEMKLEAKDYDYVTHRLAKMSLYAARDFKGSSSDGDEYEDLIMELRLTPNRFVAFSHYWRYDIDARETMAVWDGLSITPNDKLTYSFGYSQFQDVYDSMVQERYADFSMAVELSEKYSMQFAHQYDIERSTARETEWSVIRDLHDWNAAFSIRDKQRLYQESDTQITFSMSFKLPDGKKPQFPFVSDF